MYKSAPRLVFLFTILTLYRRFKIRLTMSGIYREPHNSKMSHLSGVQAALIASRKPLPPPERETTISALNKSSAQEPVYRCDCGNSEASTNWICCDGDDCPVEWYHWECVQVTDEPIGDWFCPKCSHKLQEKRQLSDQPQAGKTSVLPNLGKTAAARSTGTVTQKKKGGNTVADKGHVRVKKGTAIKKPTPKKTRRTEWVKITSDDEDDEERIDEEQRIHNAVIEKRKAQRKARATQQNKRRAQSQKRQGPSKRVSKMTKEVGILPEEKEKFSFGPLNQPRANPGRRPHTSPPQHAVGVTSE